MEGKDTALEVYFCGWEECEPGHSYGPSIREYYLIHCIRKGKGRFYSGGKEYLLKEGDGFLIFPGEVTYYEADQREPWEYAWIAFSGSEVRRILNACGLSEEKQCFFLKDTEAAEVLRDLAREEERRPVHPYEELGVLYRFFSLLAEARQTGTVLAEQYVKKAIAYIHNHFDMEVKVAAVADYVGVDRTYLYRLFMEEMGISPKQYLMDYRLKTAAKLLKKSDYSIAQIASSCGFCDAPSFNRQFKAKMGMTPKEWRKNRG